MVSVSNRIYNNLVGRIEWFTNIANHCCAIGWRFFLSRNSRPRGGGLIGHGQIVVKRGFREIVNISAGASRQVNDVCDAITSRICINCSGSVLCCFGKSKLNNGRRWNIFHHNIFFLLTGSDRGSWWRGVHVQRNQAGRPNSELHNWRTVRRGGRVDVDMASLDSMFLHSYIYILYTHFLLFFVNLLMTICVPPPPPSISARSSEESFPTSVKRRWRHQRIAEDNARAAQAAVLAAEDFAAEELARFEPGNLQPQYAIADLRSQRLWLTYAAFMSITIGVIMFLSLATCTIDSIVWRVTDFNEIAKYDRINRDLWNIS